MYCRGSPRLDYSDEWLTNAYEINPGPQLPPSRTEVEARSTATEATENPQLKVGYATAPFRYEGSAPESIARLVLDGSLFVYAMLSCEGGGLRSF